MLLLFALLDKLQDILKGPRSYQPSGGGGGGAGGGDEAAGESWVALMRERLQRHDQMVLKELVQALRDFEEELLVAADATELFDAAGVLADVLAEPTSTNTPTSPAATKSAPLGAASATNMSALVPLPPLPTCALTAVSDCCPPSL